MRLVPLVSDTIRRHAMLAGGERVLVAVSGGADSVALLHVLVSLAPALALELHVAHVDHRLRPDSGRDADFVHGLARSLGLAAHVVAVDVPAGGSIEDAARRARYGALEAIAARVGASRIAVGHTADDQAETVVMRVLQGAGPRGLAGIPAVRRARDRAWIVRPLIDLRREDVRAALRDEGLAWREDPTNTDPRFLRNRIRHAIMPALARENPRIVEALLRTARLARQTVETTERVAATELGRAAHPDVDAVTLPLDRLRALPREVAAEMLRQAAGQLGSGAPLRAWAHRGLARILAAPPPRRPLRLGGLTVEVSGARVRVGRGARTPVPPRVLVVPGATRLSEIGVTIDARLVDALEYEVPHDRGVAAFDADELPGPLVVRARQPGDRFAPYGGAERRLKDFLIDEKVPRWDRDALPLVEAAGRIAWVGGIRRGDAAPVTARTRRVLELRLTPLAEPPRAR